MMARKLGFKLAGTEHCSPKTTTTGNCEFGSEKLDSRGRTAVGLRKIEEVRRKVGMLETMIT
jgi:hypothetical protein